MQTRDNIMYHENREVVTIDEWTDRIYQNTPQELVIANVVSGRKMKIQKYNLSDTGTYEFGFVEHNLPKVQYSNEREFLI